MVYFDDDLLFYVPHTVCGGSVFVYGLVYITLCYFYFCNHHDEEERAGWFAFIVTQMPCYCKSVVALPHGAVG